MARQVDTRRCQWYAGLMTFLDRYDKDERPVAKKVLLDLAIHRISLVHSRLNGFVHDYPFDDLLQGEAVNIHSDLLDAEDLLNWSMGRASEFPWDNADFHDFWAHGGDFNKLKSMTEYIAQMPDWYRTIAAAEDMPREYGQALIDAIPEWHAG